MSKAITLHVKGDGVESLPEDKVTRESETSGATIVDVVEVSSADERKSGGVRVSFEDGTEVTVEDSELVGVF